MIERNGARTYRDAGVNIAAADGWLARMRPLIRSTGRPGVLPDKGQFAGLFRLPAGRWKSPVLVASTDGVGTKLKVAQLVEPAGRHPERASRSGASRGINPHYAIGIDAVAMNVNDVLVFGAEPLFFLDYLAVGAMQPALMSTLVKGVAEGCRQSGCALLGGETAEMPGVYRRGEYDIAGFCVAAVSHERLIDGSKVRAGDVIVGLASSGPHANGFSLIRKALSAAELKRHSQALLAPTRIYVRPVLDALKSVPIHAIAHVTGGGMARRIPSLTASRKGLAARLISGSWPVPEIFRIIQRAGRISAEEMMRTFNMGIGMALVCAPSDSRRLQQRLSRSGIPSGIIGTIERTR